MNNRRLKGLPSWKRIRLVEYYIHLMYSTLIKKQNTSKTEEQNKLRKTFFRVVLRMEKTLRNCNKEEIPVILDYVKDCPDLMFRQFILFSLRKTGHYLECVDCGFTVESDGSKQDCKTLVEDKIDDLVKTFEYSE